MFIPQTPREASFAALWQSVDLQTNKQTNTEKNENLTVSYSRGKYPTWNVNDRLFSLTFKFSLFF